MRARTKAVITGGLALSAAAAITAVAIWPASAAAPSQPSAAALALARQTLAAGDGWAAAGTGTTGGAAADAEHTFVVRTRAELITALGGNNATNGQNATPKIIFIAAKINANVNDANEPLTCADYEDPAYDLDQYLATYDPAVWGRVAPTGPLEEARVRSTRNQRDRIMINVGSNTSIIGLKGGKLVGANLLLTNISNVIIRNVSFEDAADCFPAWTPTDGSAGNWNSLYDNVTLSGTTNVWFDHNTMTDGANQDETQPVLLGRPYQVHDGLIDIIRGSDLVTLSYNNMFEHDKSMLIGSTNTPGVDVGKLRVTMHHNRFANLGQRLPRVRFGQVDVYNNYFYLTDEDRFQYALGVGVFAQLYAENNFFLRSADIPLSAVVFDWRGTQVGSMTEIGSLTRVGTGPIVPVNFLAEYNAAFDPDITADAGWVPALRLPVDPTADVPATVTANAGVGKLGV
jgi:pectate lyase